MFNVEYILLGYQDVGETNYINFRLTMSGRARGRVFAAPKHRAKMVTKQVVESSHAPDRQSEEMEVENLWTPDRESAGMKEENPRAPCRESENYDVKVEALGEVVKISP